MAQNIAQKYNLKIKELGGEDSAKIVSISSDQD